MVWSRMRSGSPWGLSDGPGSCMPWGSGLCRRACISKSQVVPDCCGSALQNSFLLENSRSVHWFVFTEEFDLPILKIFPILRYMLAGVPLSLLAKVHSCWPERTGWTVGGGTQLSAVCVSRLMYGCLTVSVMMAAHFLCHLPLASLPWVFLGYRRVFSS